MSDKLYHLFLSVVAILAGFFIFPSNSFASLSLVKDTITSSRPSASTPLVSSVIVGSAQATVFDNYSRFIASDSAKLIGGPAALEAVTVASMSAANTPTSGQRIVYFASGVAGSHMANGVIMTPVTAKHTISFSTTALPSSGTVNIVFPVGDTTNQASPSASGFSFNGLVAGNIAVTGISVSACTPTAATGTIVCTLSSSFAGGAVTVTVGSTTPALVNPTKTAVAGTTDVWTITIKTYDNNGTLLDTSKARAGTIDSIDVYGTVDPSFSMTIAGKTAGAAVNIGNATGCTTTEIINTGISSTATDVNMGTLTASAVNISSQLLTITTNGAGGYVLTATSGGHLLNPETGYWINDAQQTPTNNDVPVPVAISTGTTAFGIRPCGLDVSASTWSDGDQDCTTAGTPGSCKYANPSPTYYYTLATDSTGPVDNSVAAGNGLVTVEYGATVSGVVPAGFYRTYLTYVATPTF